MYFTVEAPDLRMLLCPSNVSTACKINLMDRPFRRETDGQWWLLIGTRDEEVKSSVSQLPRNHKGHKVSRRKEKSKSA